MIAHRAPPPSRRTAAAVLLCAAAAGIAVAMAWPAPGAAPRMRVLGTGTAVAPIADGTFKPLQPVHAPAPVASFVTGLEALPASLQGVQVPEGLGEDARGGLVLARSVRDVFDFFLSATGEGPSTEPRERLKAWILHRLGPRAAGQALVLLEAYIAYKDGLATELRGTPASTVPEMRSRVATLRAARARHFEPAVVQAFFGDDDAYDAYQLERVAVLRDGSLPAPEKARRIAALRAGRPEALRGDAEVLEVVEALDTLTADWRRRDGSPQALRQLRETLVGADGVARLEMLDRQTEAWNDRVAAYLRERARVQADPSLADSIRQVQVAALRSEAFEPHERLRIQTIERIEDSGARDPSPVPRHPIDR